ncbi:hypothetical protein [Acidovorax temperans]|uniref:hypothetical protein n=1 Tax=Acidovorax temperans TaxID=80878 RepID=UPI003CC89FD4
MKKIRNPYHTSLNAILLSLGVVLCQTQSAWASPQTTPPAKKTSPTVKHKVLKSPSEETSAQRDRRLTRECKGRPNAGACLGYAKP